MKIKVMTFNIQHGRDFIKRDINLKLMADVIRKENADIIGLNEVRGKGSHVDYQEQAKIIADYLGYHYYFGKAITLPNGPYGNAIISKFPFEKVETIMIPDPLEKNEDVLCYETRCIIKASFSNPKLTVLVTHFGLAQSEQNNALKAIINEIDSLKTPCVFMGDLNMEPSDDKITSIIQKLTDTATKFSENKLSFPSIEPNRKIDYIFVSKDIDIIEADIPQIVASDHFPHTAVLSVK